MLISSIGKPSRAEALEQAERLCSEHGIKGTESAIDMAIKSFGVLNYA
jgi:hypothetical protein